MSYNESFSCYACYYKHTSLSKEAINTSLNVPNVAKCAFSALFVARFGQGPFTIVHWRPNIQKAKNSVMPMGETITWVI